MKDTVLKSFSTSFQPPAGNISQVIICFNEVRVQLQGSKSLLRALLMCTLFGICTVLVWLVHQLYCGGRYWTMWKLPMFGCNDPGQVLSEVQTLPRSLGILYDMGNTFTPLSPFSTFAVSRFRSDLSPAVQCMHCIVLASAHICDLCHPRLPLLLQVHIISTTDQQARHICAFFGINKRRSLQGSGIATEMLGSGLCLVRVWFPR